MRVLLTGASGFIGRYVLNLLVDAGIDAVVVGRSRPDGYSGDFVEADLLQSEDYKGLVQIARASSFLKS